MSNLYTKDLSPYFSSNCPSNSSKPCSGMISECETKTTEEFSQNQIQCLPKGPNIDSHNIGINGKVKKCRSPRKNQIEKTSPRKKVDRFNGIPEEEVAKKFLPDHLAHNLDILIIGINPGLFAAYKGHHYAGPGNHFWKCLYLSGLTPALFTAYDDFRMLEHGIGFTNIVARTTRGSADLSKKEIEEGALILLTKLQFYQPKIAVFNGKGIYEIFSKKKNFFFGKQPEKIEGTDTAIWVMPSSSARCAQLPRAADKAPFYVALKLFRDHLKGLLPDLTEEELIFKSVKLTNHPKLIKDDNQRNEELKMTPQNEDIQSNNGCKTELKEVDERTETVSTIEAKEGLESNLLNVERDSKIILKDELDFDIQVKNEKT